MKLALDDSWARSGALPVADNPAPRDEDIRVALARIVAHPLFAKSIKLQHFLTYVVEETLAGRAARLKAYNIATIALGRADSFDPSQDPIVRVEASRLRRALAAYYAGDGMNDPVKILMNAGSYQPCFETGANPAEAHAEMPGQSASITQGMTKRERLLLGLIVLLFLVVICNSAMLTLSIAKLDQVERAMGLLPTATSQFEVP